ncbi:hypothetical protein A0H76_1912 [Hepatospora eriocheir]|uniref:Uncharacterized protein n=1 Tax=Hepatospora eriocheir TaxID=1081669 RepID=A0A1X0QGJ4_9MICR|nr:hypothetical protein A0H76_1912 [Hepatospora eriocheir]
MRGFYGPIEVTLHNRTFHESSPISSIDVYNNLLATSGYDKSIRVWIIKKSVLTINTNIYHLAPESSIEFEFYKELGGFESAVNVCRFYKGDDQSKDDFLIVGAGFDRIVLFNKDNRFNIYLSNNDECTDILWINKTTVIASFFSGRIVVINLIFKYTNNELVNVNQETVFNESLHSSAIRGICFNEKWSCLNTHSLDNSSKTFLLKNNKLKLISKIRNNIDKSTGIFKRNGFFDDSLYVICKKRMLEFYCYPFKEANIYKRLGPFNSSIVKIVKNCYFLVVACTKGIYTFDRHLNRKYFVESAAYGPINDVLLVDEIIYYCSEDGFVSTIRPKRNDWKFKINIY